MDPLVITPCPAGSPSIVAPPQAVSVLTAGVTPHRPPLPQSGRVSDVRRVGMAEVMAQAARGGEGRSGDSR
jgi:hypothetical protein